MILPDFILHSRVNQHWQYSGIDSLDQCMDKKWFKQYPHTIYYDYNSRGFRDQEWPESIDELKQSIWCVGDSFTTGIGSPIEHTWPWLLQNHTKNRTISISLDGASNDWIARKTVRILKEIQPDYIILHWSYLTRRESPDVTKSDEDRRLPYIVEQFDWNAAIKNFKKCIKEVESHKGACQVIHSMIPGSYPGDSELVAQEVWNNIKSPLWPDILPGDLVDIPAFIVEELKSTQQHSWEFFLEYYRIRNLLPEILENLCNVGWIEQLDLARDGHHYDLKTSQYFVQQLTAKMNF